MTASHLGEVGAPVWKRTVYVCGCVFDAAVYREVESGLIGTPYPPLTCPVHNAIWASADTRERTLCAPQS